MARLSLVSPPVRYFLLGGASGVVLSLAAFAGVIQFDAFPKESEALVMSADYRLSREEIRLREQVRYLEQELELLRRSRSISAGYATPTGS